MTYVALANITLGSSASSVTFSSIPATYRDLVLIVAGSGSSLVNFYLRFNGDSTSAYSYVYMFGGAAAESASGTQNAISQGGLATTQSNSIFQIMDYSATDKHKTVFSRFNSGTVQQAAERWANTNAVTTILAFPASGTMNAGTTLALYGIRS